MSPFARDARETGFRSKIVRHILDGRLEFALKLISEHYGIKPPGLKVGTVKGHRQVLACYVEKERCIYVSKSDYLTNPFVILHEFYHHLRATQIGRSRQVEKRADLFASNYVEDFVLTRSTGN
jgi:Zn-dependent peptidase ImmA (M78 family)